jgi:hypothetical protein
MGERVSARVWQVPDSGDTPRRHSELASDNQGSTGSLEQQAEIQEGEDMNNQHAGRSQLLAEQRITQRRQQASHALGRCIGQPIRRRRSRAPRWELQPVAGGSRSAGLLTKHRRAVRQTLP